MPHLLCDSSHIFQRWARLTQPVTWPVEMSDAMLGSFMAFSSHSATLSMTSLHFSHPKASALKAVTQAWRWSSAGAQLSLRASPAAWGPGPGLILYKQGPSLCWFSAFKIPHCRGPSVEIHEGHAGMPPSATPCGLWWRLSWGHCVNLQWARSPAWWPSSSAILSTAFFLTPETVFFFVTSVWAIWITKNKGEIRKRHHISLNFIRCFCSFYLIWTCACLCLSMPHAHTHTQYV